ncbi:sugar ABC transporter ATP-binding protein [Tropicimonas sp. IMCC6043]|uniref:sugar ABC transporter ATP-binding protein n=1 Tax=Tropicimonas sp. IMCC6043 TaxID=2510645 RepID=UPI00101C0432|nr:sugar ABC transporter ATP-binding protein [Tropicimonas sp. IMCC6043]RYH12330.1 sugar ABC transporter ATP-binding protein [Tropicimonas sp. IMCC6043]
MADGASPANTAPALEMRDISKTFGSVRALRDVSMVAYAGEVHALMGENGAGKSTLMKILSGAYSPDHGGHVLVEGTPLPPGNPKEARARGVAVIYQELSLAPNLTVAENLFLGEEISRGWRVDRQETLRRTKVVLDRLGVDFAPDTIVSRLSLGERQLVEIARAMAGDSRIIVMDEPTTSLSNHEVSKLFDVIAGLKADGIAILYISHRMNEVYALADRCSVLRDGTYIGTLEHDEIDEARLLKMMVGRDISSFYAKDHSEPDPNRKVVLRVENMADRKHVHGCSFEVHEGEVLGIAGLVGSGRTELARLIYGADPSQTGKVFIGDTEVTPKSPREGLENGIVYLTEDRKILGLFLEMSIADNIGICVLDQDAGRGGVRDLGATLNRAKAAVKALDIRTPSATLKVGALSGGNQQKVLLGRLLELKPRVLLLDEPTRGVDVGAKSEIYRLIDGLARQGLAVVMISSELPEIVGMADRVLVMRDGQIVGTIARTRDRPITQEAIMAFATHSKSVAGQATDPQGDSNIQPTIEGPSA